MNFVDSEYHEINEVLLHTPTANNMFYASLHPQSALYKGYCDIYDAIKEHKNFTKYLEEMGVVVFQLRDILIDGTMVNNKIHQGRDLQNLRNFARKFIEIDKHQDIDNFDFEEYFKNLHPYILVDIIFTQPKIHILKGNTNKYGIDAQYSSSNLTNLHSTRDPVVILKHGVVIGKMLLNQRKNETEVLKFALNKVGVKILYEVQGEGRLEGGDYLAGRGVAFIGCGARTNYEAIKQLLENKVFGEKLVVVVKDRLLIPDQPQLDAYFNIISKKLIVIAKSRLESNNSANAQLLIDVWSFEKGTDQYTLVSENDDLVKFLHSRRISIIEINEQDFKGCNFLTIRENHIVCDNIVSEDFRRKMRENQVKVDYLDIQNLSKSCSLHGITQVISRKKRNTSKNSDHDSYGYRTKKNAKL